MKHIKRILLIHPPGNRVVRSNGERGLKAAVPPLGIAYIAAVLREKLCDVRILDCIAEGYDNPEVEIEPEIFRYGLTDEELLIEIRDYSPDLVGISCPQTSRQLEANRVAELVKKVNPEIVTVMGGASPSALWKELIINRDIDYIVRGECEYRFAQLIDALNTSSDLSTVEGLVFQSGESVRANNANGESVDINGIPLPAYDLLPMKKYFNIRKNPSVHQCDSRTTVMITSRGCASECYYCPVHNVFGTGGPSYRYRSIENILKELDVLVNIYGVNEIQFEDANFNANAERTKELSNAIGATYPALRWCTPHGNQISTLTDDVLEAMHAGGCYSLYLAVESANEEFLSHRKSSVKLRDLQNVIISARRLGFVINTFFMIGYPEETLAHIDTTIEFALSLDVDNVHFFIATPFPGTEMYEMCRTQKLLLSDRSWRHYRYSSGVIQTAEFTPAYLQEKRRSGWIRFNKIKASRDGSDALLDEKRVYG